MFSYFFDRTSNEPEHVSETINPEMSVADAAWETQTRASTDSWEANDADLFDFNLSICQVKLSHTRRCKSIVYRSNHKARQITAQYHVIESSPAVWKTGETQH